MNVKVNNDSYVVSICELCEDSATPKLMRSIISDKYSEPDELAELRAKAEEMGFSLVKADRSAPHEQPVQDPPQMQLQPQPQTYQPIVEKIDTPAITSDGTKVEKFESYDLSQIRTPDGQVIQPKREVKEEQVYKSGSRSVRLPKKISGDDGETTIKIVNTGGDKIIQDRARMVRDMDINYRDIGQPRDCMSCGATGLARIGGGDCQKCGGSGMIL